MTNSSTHPSLLSRLRDSRDQAAWTEFEGRYRGLVVGYARRIGLSAWDADDVSQAVFMRLTRTLARFEYDRERGRFRGWLLRLVRNAVSEVRARTRIEEEAGEGLEQHPAPLEEDSEALFEGEWMRHHYRLALRSLGRELDARSVAVFDRLVAGASVDEVAEEFGMGGAAVQKIKQRARAKLRERIAHQLADEEEGRPGG